jgi:hypothetical protein
MRAIKKRSFVDDRNTTHFVLLGMTVQATLRTSSPHSRSQARPSDLDLRTV